VDEKNEAESGREGPGNRGGEVAAGARDRFVAVSTLGGVGVALADVFHRAPGSLRAGLWSFVCCEEPVACADPRFRGFILGGRKRAARRNMLLACLAVLEPQVATDRRGLLLWVHRLRWHWPWRLIRCEQLSTGFESRWVVVVGADLVPKRQTDFSETEAERGVLKH